MTKFKYPLDSIRMTVGVVKEIRFHQKYLLFTTFSLEFQRVIYHQDETQCMLLYCIVYRSIPQYIIPRTRAN